MQLPAPHTMRTLSKDYHITYIAYYEELCTMYYLMYVFTLVYYVVSIGLCTCDYLRPKSKYYLLLECAALLNAVSLAMSIYPT